MTNRFRNSNNVRFLKELFFETAVNRDNVLYTLKNEDHEGYPSLYRLFMESNDPTEYQFATQYLDGWEHWKILSECTWFKPYVQKWREELNIKIRSEVWAKVIKKASGTDKDALSAAKMVEDVFGDRKTGNARGRPSKAEIKANAEKMAAEASRLEDDLARISNPAGNA